MDVKDWGLTNGGRKGTMESTDVNRIETFLLLLPSLFWEVK